jgi:hypothetical protein
MWRQLLKSFIKPRGIAQLIFVVIGSFGLIYFLFLCPSNWINANQRLEVVLRGIASSLLLVGGLDLLSVFFQVAADNPDRDKFERFFGSGIRNGVIAIFPSAKSVPDPNNPSFCSITFVNPPKIAEGKKAKGTEFLVVSQDLEAALELAETFRSFGEEFSTELDEKHLKINFDKEKRYRVVCQGAKSVLLSF